MAGMAMETVRLSPKITASDVVDLARYLGSFSRSTSPIVVDFNFVRHFELMPMTLLLGTVLGWAISEDKSVRLAVDPGCRVFPYMQRMNFFERCGLSAPEYFTRRPSGKRFKEFAMVGSQGQVDAVAEEIADCVVPWQAESFEPSETQCHGCVWYCVSELLLNAVQHSWSSGYVGCQYYPSKKSIQIAIADHGRGIRASFKDSTYEDRASTDVDAIKLAVEPLVTRNRGLPGLMSENRGVGLAILRQLAQRSGGKFTLISGNAAMDNDYCFELGEDCRYRGTFAAFEFKQAELGENFERILEEAKTYTDDFSHLDLEDMFT